MGGLQNIKHRERQFSDRWRDDLDEVDAVLPWHSCLGPHEVQSEVLKGLQPSHIENPLQDLHAPSRPASATHHKLQFE